MALVTGMSLITCLGTDAIGVRDKMYSGKSGVCSTNEGSSTPAYSSLGAEIPEFNVMQSLKDLSSELPNDMQRRLKLLLVRLPEHVHYTLWLVAKAWLGRNTENVSYCEAPRVAVIVAGHNLNNKYVHQNSVDYLSEPDFVDGLYSSSSLDSIHAAAASELLGATGPTYTVGSACASGAHALRSALFELSTGEIDQIYVVGTVFHASPVELDNMVLMQAAAGKALNGIPSASSRPFDKERFGFVPAKGGACLILEPNKKENAHLGKIAGLAVSSDAQHLPITNAKNQETVMRKALDKSGVPLSQIAFVSAHATSTINGDQNEIYAIRSLCQSNGISDVPVIAPKSMLGHCLWSAALVETALALLQLNEGKIHGNPNLDNPDPCYVASFCSRVTRNVSGDFALKNAFGFGGYNASIVLEKGT